MLAGQSFPLPSSEVFKYPNYEFTPKRKRRPAGTPDPDAEVVYLSPGVIMESARYVCEICNQSFQREQNLQMHRRRHKVPWKLLKREKPELRKRVYVCPELTCLHHDPCHALGDLVGIKKHFRRKHSNHKQWVCEKCSKGYAVQSDFKAHIKICGTRGHSCDCGRVFSRVEAFIEHQDACKASMTNYVQLAGTPNEDLSHSSFNPVLLRDPNFSNKPADTGVLGLKKFDPTYERENSNGVSIFCHNLGLELFPSSCSLNSINLSVNVCATPKQNHRSTQSGNEGKRVSCHNTYWKHSSDIKELPKEAFRLRVEAKELSRIAKEQKAMAEEKRKEVRCLIGMAMQEMNKAKKIREEALADFHAAQVLKECSTRKINSNVLQITCNACRKEFLTLSQEASYAETISASSSFSSAILEAQEGNSNLMLWSRCP